MAAARARHGKGVIVIGFVCSFAIDRSDKAIKNASGNTQQPNTRVLMFALVARRGENRSLLMRLITLI